MSMNRQMATIGILVNAIMCFLAGGVWVAISFPGHATLLGSLHAVPRLSSIAVRASVEALVRGYPGAVTAHVVFDLLLVGAIICSILGICARSRGLLIVAHVLIPVASFVVTLWGVVELVPSALH